MRLEGEVVNRDHTGAGAPQRQEAVRSVHEVRAAQAPGQDELLEEHLGAVRQPEVTSSTSMGR